jgi:hydrogenase maturation protease
LRGDDGVGWQAAVWLAEQLPSTAVSVLACHQLTPELAEPISRAERVIFIDAAVEGVPGELHGRPVTAEAVTEGAFSHHQTPGGLLALAELLYGRKPQAHLFTITGHSFGYEECLSATVTAVLPRLYAEIEQLKYTR